MAKKQEKPASQGEYRKKRNGWRTFGRVIGTIALVGVLALLVFACLFALYVKNDLAQQNDFSLEGFALDQTSCCKSSMAAQTGRGSNTTKFQKILSMPVLPLRISALWSIRASTGSRP